MGRPWRIEHEGALYHVLSRGNERRDIFFDDRDRRGFLNALGDMSERFEVELFAFVLMPNHYHLLLKTHQANLSKCMQWLGVTYANRFNARHARSGHLFQGRFKSLLIQDDAYLMRLSLYIHRNPLRAGLVARLSDYSWSSYPAYACGRKAPPWLSMDLILAHFKEKNQHTAYRKQVQRYVGEESRLLEDLRYGMFFSSEKFVSQMRERYLSGQPHKEIPQQRAVARYHDPQRLLEDAATHMGCDLNRFRESARIAPQDRDNRDLLVYLIWQTGMFTTHQIGQLFGLTYSSISHITKRLKKKRHSDLGFKEKLHKLYSQFKM